MDREVRWSVEAAQDLQRLALLLDERVGLESAQLIIGGPYSQIEKLGE